MFTVFSLKYFFCRNIPFKLSSLWFNTKDQYFHIAKRWPFLKHLINLFDLFLISGEPFRVEFCFQKGANQQQLRMDDVLFDIVLAGVANDLSIVEVVSIKKKVYFLVH